jgi:hypothetical protein
MTPDGTLVPPPVRRGRSAGWAAAGAAEVFADPYGACPNPVDGPVVEAAMPAPDACAGDRVVATLVLALAALAVVSVFILLPLVLLMAQVTAAGPLLVAPVGVVSGAVLVLRRTVRATTGRSSPSTR